MFWPPGIPPVSRNIDRAAASPHPAAPPRLPGRRTLAGLIKRSFSLAGHRTSVALEAEFWDVLGATAQSRGISLSALVASVDAGRDGETPLASSLRILGLREARRWSDPPRQP
jgi:predicted DNA-binding ribbon-helix-helix protein